MVRCAAELGTIPCLREQVMRIAFKYNRFRLGWLFGSVAKDFEREAKSLKEYARYVKYLTIEIPYIRIFPADARERVEGALTVVAEQFDIDNLELTIEIRDSRHYFLHERRYDTEVEFDKFLRWLLQSARAAHARGSGTRHLTFRYVCLGDVPAQRMTVNQSRRRRTILERNGWRTYDIPEDMNVRFDLMAERSALS